MKKITNKIVLLAAGLVVLVSASSTIFFTISIQRQQANAIEQLSEVLYKDFDILIQSEVETAHSMLTRIYKLSQEGVITDEQARSVAECVLREARYGSEGYFWADKSDGTNVVLLGRDTEGKNRYELKDEKGNFLIKDIIAAAKNGGGYTDYWFAKKGGGEPMPKRGYSKYFSPYDWVIGTGNYTDDIQLLLNGKIDANKAIQHKILSFTLLGVLLLVFIAILTAIILGRRISAPVSSIARLLPQVAKGDLMIDIKIRSNDEVGLLADSINNMLDKLRSLILDIKASASQIMEASRQISSSSQLISQGAATQAGASEEMSSTIEEVLANIEQNSENASQSEKISLDASQQISYVNDTSQKSLQSIQNIASRIDIINDIAFQTNILALNAAVEAARAGEHGRGFAIVAGEVRKLAEKSKQAADEIVELSGNSVKVTEESAKRLTKLLPEIERTAAIVQEIAAASKEQSTGMSEINAAVQQLSHISQQNAASSEQLAASAEELASQASHLHNQIGYFKVDEKKYGLVHTPVYNDEF